MTNINTELKEVINYYYWEKMPPYSMTDLAEMLNMDVSSISLLMDKLKIPKRTHSETMTNHYQNHPELKETRAKKSKQMWSDPKFRLRWSSKWKNPELRKKHIQRIKQFWKDNPEFREEFIKRTIDINTSKLSKSKIIILKFLKKKGNFILTEQITKRYPELNINKRISKDLYALNKRGLIIKQPLLNNSSNRRLNQYKINDNGIKLLAKRLELDKEERILMKTYKKEKGINPIWRGKPSKKYKNWKRMYKKEERKVISP